MPHDIPATNVVPLSELFGDTEEETKLLRAMAENAESYLLSHRWCAGIKRGFFGDGVGKVFAAFLFQIEPTEASMDQWLWVVNGDIPSAYMVTDRINKPSDVVLPYVELVQAWIDAVLAGRNLAGVFPFAVEPTEENATLLEQRLVLLRELLLASFQASEYQAS